MNKHCEICDTVDLCTTGQIPCHLCGEFIAAVPATVANKLLEEIHTAKQDKKKPKKFIDADAALFIAEEALRAGYRAANEHIGSHVVPEDENRAWDEFEPSEFAKELTK